MATKKTVKCKKASSARPKRSSNKTRQNHASSIASNPCTEQDLTSAETKRRKILLEDPSCSEILNAEQVECICGNTIALEKGYKYYLIPWYKHKNRCEEIRKSYYAKGLDMPYECLAAEFGRAKASEIMAGRESGEVTELTSAPRVGRRRGQGITSSESSGTGAVTSQGNASRGSHGLDEGSEPSAISSSSTIAEHLTQTNPTPFRAVLSVDPEDVELCRRIEKALPRVSINHDYQISEHNDPSNPYPCVLEWNILKDTNPRPIQGW
ncbi:hypothetical protein EV360DRAFT_80122 [Lentinula raphanica]|nr:hypothetical protein EV360DRAFT_80122 [Lentinula raphanica]